jgi:hypothetical protein
MKCWNCNGLGLIPAEFPDDGYNEFCTYGEKCPICKHGKISLWQGIKYKYNFLIPCFELVCKSKQISYTYVRICWFHRVFRINQIFPYIKIWR